ncbi:TetR family transcriptional regulator [Prauserella shujinwangii]|uniref:TetR family transcriptional regulator n=1 Tax=Prauserella shujinwangii TaxID=1453103 RepID=A0A2T0M319_9PSEU|nr:TetR/AcrR family transcriptional regulator C-terminal domain-containing protein [Prauserella shujinwangii]PRX51143.1 TetR family transcriptional regulator [Prauserella shujinwangii]
MTAEEPSLPAHVRMWMPQPKRGRGPAPAYSREQIADAAIGIADRDGLGAVSMRKVAAELGTGAMSLYRYVENKHCLYELMADRMLGRREWPELTGDWRTDLRDLARGQRAIMLEHPWLTEVWSGRPTLGPNMLAGLERALSIVDGLGMGIDDMFETVGMIDAWVTGYVKNELAARADLGGVAGEELQRQLGGYVESLVASGEYPYFTRIVREARGPHSTYGEHFERTLDRLLAGIEATLPPRGRE